MTDDQIHPEPGNPPKTLPGRRGVTKRHQKRPLKQLSDRSETPSAVTP